MFSFLNVVIYRVPRKISFVGGRSFCPDCGHGLGAPDMFPVLSYLFLRGRCRYCKSHISLRYPIVEILGGLASLLCMAVYIDWEGNLWMGFLRFLTAFALLAVLTVVAFVDWDTMEIPNGFVLAAAVCGLVSFFVFPETGWRSFPFSKALLHGAVGYKVFPINTLAAKREEDLSGNGAAARPFSRHKAPCLLCLCKRE